MGVHATVVIDGEPRVILRDDKDRDTTSLTLGAGYSSVEIVGTFRQLGVYLDDAQHQYMIASARRATAEEAAELDGAA